MDKITDKDAVWIGEATRKRNEVMIEYALEVGSSQSLHAIGEMFGGISSDEVRRILYKARIRIRKHQLPRVVENAVLGNPHSYDSLRELIAEGMRSRLDRLFEVIESEAPIYNFLAKSTDRVS